MEVRLNDSEMVIMSILWQRGETRATIVADLARESVGWEKNTAYTIIQRLVKKGIVKRREPGFLCSAVYKEEDIRKIESKTIVDKLCGGSLNVFVRSFLDEYEVSEKDLAELRKLIDKNR